VCKKYKTANSNKTIYQKHHVLVKLKCHKINILLLCQGFLEEDVLRPLLLLPSSKELLDLEDLESVARGFLKDLIFLAVFACFWIPSFFILERLGRYRITDRPIWPTATEPVDSSSSLITFLNSSGQLP
jgi:hypothetical protein